MPRIARIIAPEYPHHITQRGNNRSTVFFDDEDRQTYLKLLEGYSRKHHVQIWAYCLMSNHVHLLVVPETENSLSSGIGLTNQMYTQYLNRKIKPVLTYLAKSLFLVRSRKRSISLGGSALYRTQSFKAGLTASLEEYAWSSAKAHISGSHDPLLSANSWLSSQERSAYSDYVRMGDEETESFIRRATTSGRPFGSESFIDLLEFRLNQTLKTKKPGRPRKKTGECP